MEFLNCATQSYEWGRQVKNSQIRFFIEDNAKKTDRRLAELWIGVHPSGPSVVCKDNELLEFFLKREENVPRFFSSAHQRVSSFSNQVPFLLKILSIGKPLSIQAHPSKKLAPQLHKKDPKNYKDENHKPELLVAISPVEALCGIRPLSEIVGFATSCPILMQIMKPALKAHQILATSLLIDSEKNVLRSLFSSFYLLPDNKCQDLLLKQRDWIKETQEIECKVLKDANNLFCRLLSQYPGDVGCWMAYILRYVRLSPTDAIFLRDSEPHAYISGEGIEIMANSDNVVRAGLTPKFKDVQTLLSMLTYDSKSIENALIKGKPKQWIQWYCPPLIEFPEFALLRCNLDTSRESWKIRLPFLGLGLCLEGSGKINQHEVKRGDTFLLPFGEIDASCFVAPFTFFIGTLNHEVMSSSKI